MRKSTSSHSNPPADRVRTLLLGTLLSVASVTACSPERDAAEQEEAAELPVAAAVVASPQATASAAPVEERLPSSPRVEVTMTDNRFTPGTVTVPAGGTVVWRNTSQMVHTVTGNGFSSGNLAPGATYSRTFGAAGTHSYHCVPHGQAGMVGTVVVK